MRTLPRYGHVADLHPDVARARGCRDVPERRRLEPAVLVVGVGEVVLDDVVELVVDVAVDLQAGPAELGGRRVSDPVAAAAGEAKTLLGPISQVESIWPLPPTCRWNWSSADSKIRPFAQLAASVDWPWGAAEAGATLSGSAGTPGEAGSGSGGRAAPTAAGSVSRMIGLPRRAATLPVGTARARRVHVGRRLGKSPAGRKGHKQDRQPERPRPADGRAATPPPDGWLDV